MSEPDQTSPDCELDLRGFLCPLPVLKTRKALEVLTHGALVRVLVTDPAARIDMPHYCNGAGHTLVETRMEGATLIFLIRKG